MLTLMLWWLRTRTHNHPHTAIETHVWRPSNPGFVYPERDARLGRSLSFMMLYPALVRCNVAASNKNSIALADANRSGGLPKPGRRLLNGVRQCRRRSAGGPLGPDGAPEGPWGRRGVPRGSVYQMCTDTEQSSDPSSLVRSRRAKTGF